MSNNNIAIKVEKISKHYRIGMKEKMHDSFSGVLFDLLMRPVKNYRKYRSLYRFDDIGPAKDNDNNDTVDIIWALRDVSFEVKKGEVIGIIGRNGAGKSTLLKILSKITHPSTGRAEIYGRVSSLLEVGTGFHPELTGRENVYLNGTILGMRKKEVDSKFDEIVNFSGVEKFIDTPVKRYSSGMKVRLAFSVAAHMAPEILIIDEVLAVGDADFQRKCLNKMEDVGHQGRTVLFVSHNIPAVSRLCGRTILLHSGRIKMDGPTHNVVSSYLTEGTNTMAMREWPDLKTAPGGEVARLRAVRVCKEDGQITETIDIREPVRVEMEYEVLQSGHVLLPHLLFFNENGLCVFGTLESNPVWSERPRPAGIYSGSVQIPGNFFADGMMYVNAVVCTMNPYSPQFWERSVVAFQIVDSFDGDSARGFYTGTFGGVVRPLFQWNTKFSPNGRGI